MSDETVRPLPDDISRAIALEQARPPPTDAVLELTRARIAATAGSLATAGAGGAAATLGAAKIVALLAVGAAAGAAGGIGLYAAAVPVVPVQPIVIQLPAPAPPPPAAPTEPAPQAEPPPARAERRAPKAQPPTEPAAAPTPTVETERLLVERAGVALARGEAAAALEVCDEHQRVFPTGLLAEERESVAIRALAALGRLDEARSRAKAFKEAFPRSMQRPIIDRALKSDAGVTETHGGHKNGPP